MGLFDQSDLSDPSAANRAFFDGVLTAAGFSQSGARDYRSIFPGLLEAQWGGVAFPTVGFSVEVRHDLAVHRPADRDGANVEATGLAPLEFIFDIAFFNTINPGQSESWQVGQLYPHQMLLFLAAFQDRRSQILQHPEFGQILCKPNHASFKWTAVERAGARCQAAFIQTYDAQADQRPARQSARGTLDGAASSLDTNLNASGKVPGWSPPTFGTSFSQFAFQLRGAVDQFTVLQKRYGGALGSIVGQVNALENSVDLLKGSSGALLWPLASAGEAVKAAARDVAKTILQKSKNIGLYIVPVDKTLGAVCADIPGGALVEDLIKLNPGIMASPVITARTQVRYYVS